MGFPAFALAVQGNKHGAGGLNGDNMFLEQWDMALNQESVTLGDYQRMHLDRLGPRSTGDAVSF